MLKSLVLLLALGGPALADDGLLATLDARSGTVAPPYAWSVAITIAADGLVTVKRCTGYETEGPACKTGTAQTTPEALAAIRTAAKASSLATHPAKPLDPPMVGGGSISGTVILDGTPIEMIAQPVPEDTERVTTLIDVVGAAVPHDLDPILSGD
jgi:hypothetical protein